jgi:hypothetical protein
VDVFVLSQQARLSWLDRCLLGRDIDHRRVDEPVLIRPRNVIAPPGAITRFSSGPKKTLSEPARQPELQEISEHRREMLRAVFGSARVIVQLGNLHGTFELASRNN